MPLPTPEKTWQFAHISNALSGSQTTDINDFFLKLKNALKAFGTNPLTVVGSSNGVSANMSGTDLLTGQPAMVHNDGGSAHSWIVLGMPQIAAGAQICIDFDNSDERRQSFVTSATGFSGGSITARPTAADEHVLWTNGAWTGMLGSGDGTGGQLRGHVMLSSDGEILRVVVANNNVVGGYLFVEKPGDPVSGWTNPMISWAQGLGIFNNTDNSLLSVSSWWLAVNYRATGPVGNMNLYACFEVTGNRFYVVPTRFDFANEISGEYPLCPIGLYHEDTAGQRGRHGRVVDLWFTCAVLQNGDTMPSDSSKQFIVMGDAVFANDGTDWAQG